MSRRDCPFPNFSYLLETHIGLDTYLRILSTTSCVCVFNTGQDRCPTCALSLNTCVHKPTCRPHTQIQDSQTLTHKLCFSLTYFWKMILLESAIYLGAHIFHEFFLINLVYKKKPRVLCAYHHNMDHQIEQCPYLKKKWEEKRVHIVTTELHIDDWCTCTCGREEAEKAELDVEAILTGKIKKAMLALRLARVCRDSYARCDGDPSDYTWVWKRYLSILRSTWANSWKMGATDCIPPEGRLKPWSGPFSISYHWILYLNLMTVTKHPNSIVDIVMSYCNREETIRAWKMI